MRVLARLGLAATIVGLLFVTADVLAERYAEDLVSQGVAREFDLRQRPSVDLSGFPVIPRALRGQLPDVRFTARDVLAGDLEITALTVKLDGLRGTGSLLSGPYAVEVGSGQATVTLDEESVNGFLRARREGTTVRISRGGVRVRTTMRYRGTHQVGAVARVRIRDGHLRLEPVPGTITVDGRPAPRSLEERARRQARVDVELPALPGGIKPGKVELGDGEVRISASLKRRSIQVRGA